MNTLKMTALLSTALFTGSVYAAPHITHPNLRDAFRNCNQAIHHINKAYKYNDNRGAFGGHAARAKQLLEEAKHEIKEADEYRNHQMRR